MITLNQLLAQKREIVITLNRHCEYETVIEAIEAAKEKHKVLLELRRVNERIRVLSYHQKPCFTTKGTRLRA